MAVDARSAKGAPIFYGSGADDQAADLSILGAEIYERGTRLVLTAAQMDDLVADGFAFEGIEVYCLDDGVTYVRVAGAWKRASTGVSTVVRNTTAVAIGSSNYANIGPGFGTPSVTDGVTWVTDHFVASKAGKYRVEVAVSVQGGAGLFIGVSDKATILAPPGDMLAYATFAQIQGDSAGALSREITLAANSSLYLWGLAASGTGNLRVGTSTGTPAAVGHNQYAKLERIS